jgi:UPF0716 protein FxsA
MIANIGAIQTCSILLPGSAQARLTSLIADSWQTSHISSGNSANGANLLSDAHMWEEKFGALPLMLRLLPFAFLIVPLTEIAVFVMVGQWIGILPTILLVILTAIIGASLLRHQGFGLLAKLQTEINAGRVPARDLAHGAMMIAAGVLLLTPGFVTDTLGFLLFVPALRERVFKFLSSRISIVTTAIKDRLRMAM